MSDTERVDAVEQVEVQISPDIVAQIATIAAGMAIRAVRKEEEESYKRRHKAQRKRITRSLSQYRTMKKILAQKQYSRMEQARIRWKFMEDLMADGIRSKEPDTVIQEENRRIQENLYAIYRIDNALALYEDDVRMNENDEKRRRYRILREWYIDGAKPTIEQIAEAEGISEKTAYRDIGIATEMMVVYMFGAVI